MAQYDHLPAHAYYKARANDEFKATDKTSARFKKIFEQQENIVNPYRYLNKSVMDYLGKDYLSNDKMTGWQNNFAVIAINDPGTAKQGTQQGINPNK